MFIEVADYSINTAFIAYVRYFYKDFTQEQCCTITMQNGQQIEVASYDEVQAVREALNNAGMVVMAIDEPPDEFGDIS